MGTWLRLHALWEPNGKLALTTQAAQVEPTLAKKYWLGHWSLALGSSAHSIQ
jgi:hypothetical protein